MDLSIYVASVLEQALGTQQELRLISDSAEIL